MLIVNIQIPVHPRAIFGARRLPPTVNAAFYLQMTESTATGLEALRNGGSASGPVKLLKSWCEHAEEDEALRGCLKLIGLIQVMIVIGSFQKIIKYI